MLHSNEQSKINKTKAAYLQILRFDLICYYPVIDEDGNWYYL